VASKDYSAIARQRIVSPDDAGRMPRLLVYGRNKKGKTHFANTAPDLLVIDPDDQPKPLRPTWRIDRWEDVNEAYLFLRSGKHDYKWVSLDGVTKLYSYALRWVMRQSDERAKALDKHPDQVGKQHYGRANQMFETMLQNFHALRNIGIILTAQEKMMGVTEVIAGKDTVVPDDMQDDDDYTPTSYQYIVALPKGARAPLNAMVDLTGRIYVVRGEFERRIKVDGQWETQQYTKQRRLFIGVDDMYETGYRSEHDLPDFIEDPTVKKVVRALRTGVIK
jgi:AAA domain-containing protein